MRTLSNLLCATTLICSACVATMTVHREKINSKNEKEPEAVKLKGIPFYVQKGIVKQETNYLYTWLEVSLIKEEKGVKPTTTVITKKDVAKDSLNADLKCDLKCIQGLINKSSNIQNVDSNIKEIIASISALPEPGLSPDTAALVSNSWKSDMVIDYSTKYYLNSKIPWFGTASLTQKLASNGTLTEAVSTSDSQLDELAVSAATLATGFKTANSTVRVAELQEEEVAGKADGSGPTYILKIEEKGFLYTFSRIICNGPCADDALKVKAIEFDLVNGNYTRTPWPVPTAAKPKEDKPTINVSGSIELPVDEKKD